MKIPIESLDLYINTIIKDKNKHDFYCQFN